MKEKGMVAWEGMKERLDQRRPFLIMVLIEESD
jgi:hypothetical protein